MSKKPQNIEEFIQQLDPVIAELVYSLREIILETSDEISEHIKWNSPSFYYNGEMKAFDAKTYKRDLLVINCNRGKILLVFPTGNAIAHNTQEILEGNYEDGRKIVTIKNKLDLEQKTTALRDVMLQWLNAIEK